jgi:hypothetical protein
LIEAGVNTTGGDTLFAGSLGTQVVRVFDRVIAATGLRVVQARRAGFDPIVADRTADDHKTYYPGATPLRMRIVGDRTTGRLLGAQLVGHYGAEVAKRIDIFATAISYSATVDDLPRLDPSYAPPLGSPFRRRTTRGRRVGSRSYRGERPRPRRLNHAPNRVTAARDAVSGGRGLRRVRRHPGRCRGARGAVPARRRGDRRRRDGRSCSGRRAGFHAGRPTGNRLPTGSAEHRR